MNLTDHDSDLIHSVVRVNDRFRLDSPRHCKVAEAAVKRRDTGNDSLEIATKDSLACLGVTTKINVQKYTATPSHIHVLFRIMDVYVHLAKVCN